jgi:hypothetical protein
LTILSCTHPRTGAPIAIKQAVRVARSKPFELKAGAQAEVVYWRVMPSGSPSIGFPQIKQRTRTIMTITSPMRYIPGCPGEGPTPRPDYPKVAWPHG